MAPRSAYSVSTNSSSIYTEDNNVGSHAPSIDVVSMDDPARMSPQAMAAELKYYGVDMSISNGKAVLEKALMFHRRNSGGSSQKGSSGKGSGGRGSDGRGSGGGRNNGGGSGGSPGTGGNTGGGTGGTGSGGGRHQQYEPQRPGTTPQHHLQATAAKVPGMRVTPPNSSQALPGPRSYNTKSYGSGGNNPTPIPLTANNRIPPQILNIIRINADSSMKAINLDHRNLGDKEVIKLCEAMERNRTITFLSLRNCAISDTAVKKLGSMLLRNTTLLELHLDTNRIGTEGAATLSTALITNETLAVLTLNENEGLGDKGVTYLIGALEHNTTLRTLDVHKCGMNANSEPKRLAQIETMLEDRQIDSNFESLLERLLDDDFRVTGIDLSGRRIGDKGAARLSEALNDNTQVRQLWLRGCNIGNAGAASLAMCLEQNMAIVDLFLGNNSIGNEGLVSISDALALSNLTLVSLELDDNQVSESGLDAFSRALDKNTSVLVASFENNPITTSNSGKIAMLQAKLAEKRNGLNLVSFVVDPDAGTDAGGSGVDGTSGLVNMSVCSSYMPSTYRRAGITSQMGGMRNDSGDRSELRGGLRNSSASSVQFSVYSRSKKPPPPPTKQSSPEKSPPLIKVPLTGHASPPPKSLRSSRGSSQKSKSSSHPSSHRSGSQPSKSSSRGQSVSNNSKQLVPASSQAAPAQQQQQQRQVAKPKPKSKQAARAASPPPSRSRMYERAHVPVPLKAQALAPITEQSVDTRNSDVSSRISSVKSGYKSAASKSGMVSNSQGGGTMSHHGMLYLNTKQQQQNNKTADLVPLIPKVDEGEPELNSKRSKEPTVATAAGDTTITKSEQHPDIAVNLQHPQTQRNFNETLVKLWRRVEMMKRTNHFAAAHYKARHFWIWFVPISSSMFLSVILCLAMALTPNARVGLALSTGFFSCAAFALNFLQTRFGWSTKAQVHRSAEVELGQVAFRLDTLGKYEGQGLTTGSHSTRSRANAIRDLYRIDVYLQAMQRCTPPIPNTINETFYLLASRLKDICLKYPNAVRTRKFDYGAEEMSEDNPVPVEMQIDALDLLGREIESYFLYPLLMPDARGVVSRTIDIFFANPDEQQSRDGGSRSRGGDSRDDQSYYSQDGRSYDDRSYNDRSYDSRSYDDRPYEDDGYEEMSTVV